MKDKLQTSLLILVIVGSFGVADYMVREIRSKQPSAPVRVNVGKVMKLVPAQSKDKPTLALMISTRCGFCTKSIPVYKQLLESEQVRSGALRVVAAFPQDKDEVHSYLAEQNLEVESITSAQFKDLGVTGTPTLVLWGGPKHLSQTWVGANTQAKDILGLL